MLSLQLLYLFHDFIGYFDCQLDQLHRSVGVGVCCYVVCFFDLWLSNSESSSRANISCVFFCWHWKKEKRSPNSKKERNWRCFVYKDGVASVCWLMMTRCDISPHCWLTNYIYFDLEKNRRSWSSPKRVKASPFPSAVIRVENHSVFRTDSIVFDCLWQRETWRVVRGRLISRQKMSG